PRVARGRRGSVARMRKFPTPVATPACCFPRCGRRAAWRRVGDHYNAGLERFHSRGTEPMIRVLIADDHAIVRGGFRQFVADEPDMCVAAEAATGDETISLVREQAFDVVLLDIAMPDKNGIDTLRIIKQVRPEQGVLILSGYPESQYAINLLRAGANGYLNKDCEPDEIVRAIRAVARGHRYLSEAVADTLADNLDKPAAGRPHEALSE